MAAFLGFGETAQLVPLRVASRGCACRLTRATSSMRHPVARRNERQRGTRGGGSDQPFEGVTATPHRFALLFAGAPFGLPALRFSLANDLPKLD
ncbi:hypothetical protein [Vreelandella sp. EE22]